MSQSEKYALEFFAVYLYGQPSVVWGAAVNSSGVIGKTGRWRTPLQRALPFLFGSLFAPRLIYLICDVADFRVSNLVLDNARSVLTAYPRMNRRMLRVHMEPILMVQGMCSRETSAAVCLRVTSHPRSLMTYR